MRRQAGQTSGRCEDVHQSCTSLVIKFQPRNAHMNARKNPKESIRTVTE